MIHLFSFRNFVVGTAFSKTETVQAALFGFLVLSDPITFWAMVAIVVSLAGVLLLAVADEEAGIREVISSMIQKTTVLGLASGAFFGIAAVSYRAASLSLESGFVISAAVTLVVVLVLQTVAMTIYLFLREPGQLAAVAGAWKVSSVVGPGGYDGFRVLVHGNDDPECRSREGTRSGRIVLHVSVIAPVLSRENQFDRTVRGFPFGVRNRSFVALGVADPFFSTQYSPRGEY